VLTGATVHKAVVDGSLWPRRSLEWPLLIDTGAEISIIPAFAATSLGVDLQSAGPVSLVLGDTKTVVECDTVYACIAQRDFGFINPVKVACMERKNIVLGRDALNSLLFVYDGRSSRFKLRKRKLRDMIALRLVALTQQRQDSR
jgi:hypothetical protein